MARAGGRLWADASVRTKIVWVVVVMTVAAALGAVVSARALSDLGTSIDELYAQRVTPLSQLTEIQRAFQGDRARVIQYGIADEATRAELATELAERRADLDAQVEAYRPAADDPAAVDALVDAFDAY